MRTRKFIALSLLSAGAAILFSGCPAQPPTPCVLSRSSGGGGAGAGTPYVVQYFYTAGSATADCADAEIAGSWPAGDFYGAVWAEAYGVVTASNKLTGMVPEEFGWTSQYTGGYVECSPFDDATCPHNPVIFGNFTADTEDSNGNCTSVGTDAGVQTVNGIVVSYAFNETLFYVNPAAGEGTEMQAKVTINRTSLTSGASCTRDYTAIGLWPAVVCNVPNDCNPDPQPGIDPPRPIGSGTLPGQPITCNLTAPSQDPILVPGDVLYGFNDPPSCDVSPDLLPDGGTQPGPDQPFIYQSGGCGGGAKDNNNVGGTGICFYTAPSATTFPYTN